MIVSFWQVVPAVINSKFISQYINDIGIIIGVCVFFSIKSPPWHPANLNEDKIAHHVTM